jgi:hypothetical protein
MPHAAAHAGSATSFDIGRRTATNASSRSNADALPPKEERISHFKRG